MKSKEYMITAAMLLLVTYTLSLSFVSQAFPAVQTSKTLSSTGAIQIQTSAGIGIYSNSQCNSQLSSMTWGTLEPGAAQNIVCYIKNEGTMPTILSMQTSDWTPSTASDYLSLTWDYSELAIDPGVVVQITFMLNVSPDVTGITNFSFDVIIIGSS